MLLTPMHTQLRRSYATLDATGAEILLLFKCSALNCPYPIHAADGYYIRNSTQLK